MLRTTTVVSLFFLHVDAAHGGRISSLFAGGGCSDITINVSVMSQNIVFASPRRPDPDNSTAIVDFMLDTWPGTSPTMSGTAPASDTFAICGMYSAPALSRGSSTSGIATGSSLAPR